MVWASQSANAKRRPQNTLIWVTVVTKRSYLIAMQIGGSARVLSGFPFTQRVAADQCTLEAGCRYGPGVSWSAGGLGGCWASSVEAGSSLWRLGGDGAAARYAAGARVE